MIHDEKRFVEYCKTMDFWRLLWRDSVGCLSALFYRPLFEVTSSKSAWKTYVDLINEVRYASGLHGEGSKAVSGYGFLELADWSRLPRI